MGELSVRRNRGLAAPRYEKTARTEKSAGSAAAQKTGGTAREAVSLSATLGQLMDRVNQAARYIREGRRALQSGEASLAEVRDSLERMEELARRSAEGEPADRSQLQSQLDQLRDQVRRIVQEGVAKGLFQDGQDPEGLEEVMDVVIQRLSARQEGMESLPAWLLRSMTASEPGQAALLASLGLDQSATGPELLAALSRLSPEENSAAGYLAALYLGAVIAGTGADGTVDRLQAAEALWQLLEAVAQGLSPDEAVEALTGGMFSSMEEFQAQFSGGSAPGLEAFLTQLLLSRLAGAEQTSLLDLLAGSGTGDMDLLLDLLAALEDSGGGLLELLDGAGTAGEAARADLQTASQGALSPEGAGATTETKVLGGVQLTGEDLSGVKLDRETGVLTIEGSEKVILRGLGQQAPAIRLAGSGQVILHQVRTPLLTVESGQAEARTEGEAVIVQVRLGKNAVLTLESGGLARLGQLEGKTDALLRLTGGAVAIDAQEAGEALPVVVDGPVSLVAAAGIAVRNPQGEALSPADVLWKSLFPSWSALTAMAVDGRQGRLMLAGDHPDPLRLWLWKGDLSQGYPAHSVVFRGRDRSGSASAGYVYLRWSQQAGAFQPVSMYPNPFTVTGGEQEVDWRYEEESRTLHILTGQVTAIAGGTGTDLNQLPFSGRIVLADRIGQVTLTLNGVVCRVPAGGAFRLGKKNDVTLLLRSGTRNLFESGPGYAGISLGEGASLRIDQVKKAPGEPDGYLSASGGSGGAGIGRDSGGGQTKTGAILIRGGMIEAAGSGGGAGIGGGLGAAVGDIRIQGGVVSAQADCCAAAIGAGIQGNCGDIVITGAARIAKAKGGGPEGDIGGCVFGNCGKVQVSAGADTCGAKLWTQKGLSIQIGEDAVTLPRFPVSARSLRLEGLDLSTREGALASMAILVADKQWVNQIQRTYGAMYGQLEQKVSGLDRMHRYIGVVRDTKEANALLYDMRQALKQTPAAAFRRWGAEDVGQLLR